MTLVMEGIALDDSLRPFIVEKMTAATSRGRLRPTAARVGFTDENGPKGGVGIRCALTVEIPRRPPAHHCLMVGSVQKKRSEAAGIDLLQPLLILRRDAQRAAGPRLVHCFSIRRGRERHVVRVLVAALDLQRRDADIHDFRHLMQRVQIARRKQVARIAQRPQVAIHQHDAGAAQRQGTGQVRGDRGLAFMRQGARNEDDAGALASPMIVSWRTTCKAVGTGLRQPAIQKLSFIFMKKWARSA